ncbi:hypothetical protein Ndes2437A_g07865 [Nannochloris sp. 'desiccata']
MLPEAELKLDLQRTFSECVGMMKEGRELDGPSVRYGVNDRDPTEVSPSVLGFFQANLDCNPLLKMYKAILEVERPLRGIPVLSYDYHMLQLSQFGRRWSRDPHPPLQQEATKYA